MASFFLGAALALVAAFVFGFVAFVAFGLVADFPFTGTFFVTFLLLAKTVFDLALLFGVVDLAFVFTLALLVVALDCAVALVFAVALGFAFALGFAVALAFCFGFTFALVLVFCVLTIAFDFGFTGALAFVLLATFFFAGAFLAFALALVFVPFFIAVLLFAAIDLSVATMWVLKKSGEPYQIGFVSPSQFDIAQSAFFLGYYRSTQRIAQTHLNVAKRLEEIEPFRVMALLARANELSDAGHNVIHLEVGEPDFGTPRPIVNAGRIALETGQTKYTNAKGIPELREAVSSYYHATSGISISPERIFITAGASGGLLLLSALLLDPGQNLLMTDPGYPCNRHFLTSFNAQGILVPVDASDNYQLTPALIDQHWDEQSRGVLLASPANPTGAVLSSSDLSQLSSQMAEREGLLIVDEIYQGLVYENQGRRSVLEIDPNAFVINSFSKYFGMTGWRLGWVVVPQAVTTDLEKLAQNLFICPSTIAQHAALAAFDEESLAIMESQKQEFRQRRDYLVPALRELGFDVPLMPAGAFYVYAQLPPGAPDSEQFCERLLEEEFVATTPGTDFGFHRANRFVRISYAREIEQLSDAVGRIGRWLS